MLDINTRTNKTNDRSQEKGKREDGETHTYTKNKKKNCDERENRNYLNSLLTDLAVIRDYFRVCQKNESNILLLLCH